MTAVTTHICDSEACKKERAGPTSISVFSHTTPDASGNGSEKWRATFDLCSEHLHIFTTSLIHEMEDQRGRTTQRTPLEIVKDLHIKYELL